MPLHARKRWAAVAAMLVVGLVPLAAAGPASAASATYRDATDAVRNPERGFYVQQEDLPGPLTDVRASGATLVRAYFRLDEHRDAATLPPSYLQAVDGTFADAREQGVKVIVRFAYNDGSGPDAPLETVLAHIDQLGPVLQANRDTIQVIEAGFIGAWGEWHSSSNGLDAPEAKERVLRQELAAFPQDVKLALRYPRDKRALLGTTPLAREDAHSGKARARVGHHNDCFLAGSTDGGTWQDWRGETGNRERRFVDADTAYVPMGGESCLLDALEPRYAGCDNARRTLARQSWSVLNAGYYEGVLDLWRQEGCYDEIARRLGHRLALVDAEVPDALAPGAPLGLTFRVRNDGYAAPYNPRPVEVVLRHRASGATTTLATDADPRFWRAGETTSVRVDAPLPAGAASGEYDVALRLPDPSGRLRDRPEYAIRFANAGVWDEATGRNDLDLRTRVGASAPVAAVDAVVGSVQGLLDRIGGDAGT